MEDRVGRKVRFTLSSRPRKEEEEKEEEEVASEHLQQCDAGDADTVNGAETKIVGSVGASGSDDIRHRKRQTLQQEDMNDGEEHLRAGKRTRLGTDVAETGASGREKLKKKKKKKTMKERDNQTRKDDLIERGIDVRDYRRQILKKDHLNRPLWICPNGHIFFETAATSSSFPTSSSLLHNSIYKPAYDFLIAVAEPVSRQREMHEYVLTPHSLRAAVSVGLSTETITRVLDRLSKSPLPIPLIAFIAECTRCYGKCKLVIRHNKFFVESKDPSLLMKLLQDKVIRDSARAVIVNHNHQNVRHGINDNLEFSNETLTNSNNVIDSPQLKTKRQYKEYTNVEAFLMQSNVSLEVDEAAEELARVDNVVDTNASSQPNYSGERKSSEEEEQQGKSVRTNNGKDNGSTKDVQTVHSFEIDPSRVEFVKSRCMHTSVNCPLLEEYDFRNDTVNSDLDIQLKPHVDLRPYQEKGLSKMFGNGRARSGIIVLPCGAGKSLLGIAAACRIGKSVLCLCTNSVSVDQWKYQFELWTNLLGDTHIGRFTGENKHCFTGESGVLISTFQMLAEHGRRSDESRKFIDVIQNREWGLLIMDEVHVVPANMFRKVIGVVKAHCKLGLTATLVREDELISDLNFLIGPKLYEANWMDLTRAGHLAKVQCSEVWCPMTPEFMRAYLRDEHGLRRQLLYVMNPYKFLACKALIAKHEATRGDKIIVFSDNIFALREYALRLHKPFIYGDTSHGERTRILNTFKLSNDVNTIFLSKVGDNSIDIPNANVIIQISSHAGSRRQEAQRLGRILRPKSQCTISSVLMDEDGNENAIENDFNAYFYSLVSTDTREMFFSTKREEFLINQGYAFRIITNILDDTTVVQSVGAKHNGLHMSKEEQLNLLAKVLEAGVDDNAIEGTSGEETGFDAFIDDLDGNEYDIGNSTRPEATRITGNMRALSGASGMAYAEFERQTESSRAKSITAKKPQPKGNSSNATHKLLKQRHKMSKSVYH